MKRASPILIALTLAFLPSLWPATADAEDACPLQMRFESLGIPPGHLPMLTGWLLNPTDRPITAVLKLHPPSQWRLHRDELSLEVPAGRRTPFGVKIEKGLNVEANFYPLEATLTIDGTAYPYRQVLRAASAPYFKPTIDGVLDDWDDAVPATFITPLDDPQGKKTTISTVWNRRRLSILFAVEEDRLTRLGEGERPDAIQLALASLDAETPTRGEDELQRFEYLLLPTADGAQCYQLAEPGMKADMIARPRNLAGLEYDGADVIVTRKNGVTYYECSFSFSPIRDTISPSEGREFRLGFLVQDGDAGQVRQWSSACRVLRENPFAFSAWKGRLPARLLDSKTRWGMCSSKY